MKKSKLAKIAAGFGVICALSILPNCGGDKEIGVASRVVVGDSYFYKGDALNSARYKALTYVLDVNSEIIVKHRGGDAEMAELRYSKGDTTWVSTPTGHSHAHYSKLD
jgi:hypothetical protein